MTTHSEDAPLVGANEFDGVDDDTISENDYRGMNWRKTIFAGLGLVALLVAAPFGWEKYEQSTMPAMFIVKPGDTMIAHTEGNLDRAITAARRTDIPVMATEMCGVPHNELVPLPCGVAHPVSYSVARKLKRTTRTVELNPRIYEGDLVDAQYGVYIPRKDQIEIMTYMMERWQARMRTEAWGLNTR